MKPRKTGKDRIDRERLVRTLQSLVKIPSFEDSVAVSRWIRNELEGFGYDVWSDRDGNLIAEIGNGPGFILNAHLDTVAPGDGWKHDPFGGEIDNGRVYGRGASDCKAGVASMVEIARILKAGENELKKRVVFTFTAFEEGYPIEQNGIYRILPKLKSIGSGLVLEPTVHGNTMDVVIGCRGSMHYNLRIMGKRGHSAYPWLSDNPIYKFPALLEQIKKFPKKSMKIGMLGREIEDLITVTELCAKEGRNIIPAKCEVTIDRRSLPGESPEESREKLESLCRESLGNDFRLVQESGIQGYCFEDVRFLRMCREAIESAGYVPRTDFLMARIDSAILYNLAGIGTFMLGPGSIGQAHRTDEHCEVGGLSGATKAVLGVIKRWDAQS
jgi:succinyl-diaminopimelate desuccinylase